MSDAALIAAELADLRDRLAAVEAVLGPFLADQAAALDPRTHAQRGAEGACEPSQPPDALTPAPEPEARRTAPAASWGQWSRGGEDW